MSGDERVPDPPAEEAAAGPGPAPPRTGIEQIDEVTQRLAELPDTPLSEHHDRLAEAQAALHEALHAEPTPSQPVPALPTSPTGQRDPDRPARP